jgi:hypothetical protein
MNHPKPYLNPGSIAGRQFLKLREAEAAQGIMSPYDLGQFRKAYWKARCHVWIEDLASTVKYMRTEDIRMLEQRVAALYRQTLTEMYGEQGAKDFLEETEESKYRGEAE